MIEREGGSVGEREGSVVERERGGSVIERERGQW